MLTLDDLDADGVLERLPYREIVRLETEFYHSLTHDEARDLMMTAINQGPAAKARWEHFVMEAIKGDARIMEIIESRLEEQNRRAA